MSLITVEEKVELLKNLLLDPDDWISAEILRLSNEEDDAVGPVGINDSVPTARKKNK